MALWADLACVGLNPDVKLLLGDFRQLPGVLDSWARQPISAPLEHSQLVLDLAGGHRHERHGIQFCEVAAGGRVKPFEKTPSTERARKFPKSSTLPRAASVSSALRQGTRASAAGPRPPCSPPPCCRPPGLRQVGRARPPFLPSGRLAPGSAPKCSFATPFGGTVNSSWPCSRRPRLPQSCRTMGRRRCWPRTCTPQSWRPCRAGRQAKRSSRPGVKL